MLCLQVFGQIVPLERIEIWRFTNDETPDYILLFSQNPVNFALKLFDRILTKSDFILRKNMFFLSVPHFTL